MGINVALNQITETTTAMQYSIDSTNGINGTWINASPTNTSVTFVVGKVYVREAAVPTNFREVATISPAATAPTSGVTFDVSAGTVTGLGSTYEYSFNGGTSYVTQATGVNFLAGNVLVRTKATAAALPSSPQTVGTIAAPAAAPTANRTPGTNAGTTKLTNLTNGATYEYVVDNNATLAANAAGWTGATTILVGATEIDNIAVNLNQYVHLRIKATTTNLASNVQDIQIVGGNIKRAAAPTITSSAATNTVGFTKLEGLVDGVTYEYVLGNLPSLPGGDGDITWNSNTPTFVASGTIKDDFNAGGHSPAYIYIRVKATTSQPASEILNLLTAKK